MMKEEKLRYDISVRAHNETRDHSGAPSEIFLQRNQILIMITTNCM